MAEICVDGCTLQMTPFVSGSVEIITPPSQFTTLNGKGCYRGTLMVSISDYVGGAIVPNPGASITVATAGTGTGSISANSVACTIDGQTAVLKGAEGTVTVVGVLATPGGPVTTTQDVTVKIADAGQSDITVD